MRLHKSEGRRLSAPKRSLASPHLIRETAGALVNDTIQQVNGNWFQFSGQFQAHAAASATYFLAFEAAQRFR